MSLTGLRPIFRWNNKSSSNDRNAIFTANNTAGVARSGVIRLSVDVLGEFTWSNISGTVGKNAWNLRNVLINGVAPTFTQFGGVGGATAPTAGTGVNLVSFPATTAGGQHQWAATADTALFNWRDLTMSWDAHAVGSSNADGQQRFFWTGFVTEPSTQLNDDFASLFTYISPAGIQAAPAPLLAIGQRFEMNFVGGNVVFRVNGTTIRTEPFTITYSLRTANGATISNTAAQPFNNSFIDLDLRTATPSSNVVLRATSNTGWWWETTIPVSATPTVAELKVNLDNIQHRFTATGNQDWHLPIPTASQRKRHLFKRDYAGTGVKTIIADGSNIDGNANFALSKDFQTVELVYDATANRWTSHAGGAVANVDVRNITSSTTALTLTADHSILTYTGVVDGDVVMPGAVNHSGKTVRIIIANNNADISVEGGETIRDLAMVATVPLTINETLILVSNGTNWNVS